MRLPLTRFAGWTSGLILLGLMGWGCLGPQSFLKSADSPLLSYERTMCYGSCPAFKLDMQADGTVYFHGRAHTQPLGKYRTQWSPADLSKLAKTAVDVQLHKKAGVYDNPMVMDLPSIRLHFGKYRVLDRIDGPDIKAFYSVLDSLISASNWVPEPR